MRSASSSSWPGASVSQDLIHAVLDAAVASGIVRNHAAVALRARLGVGTVARGGAPRLSEHALLSVWDAIISLANGDHGVGALLALHADIRAFGLLGEALHHAPTLLDAYEHIARYARLTHQGVTITVEATAREFAVNYALAGTAGGQAQDARAAGLLWVMGNLALVPIRAFGVDLKPRVAKFACRSPSDANIAQTVFGADISFGAATTQIIFDRRRVDEVRRPAKARLLDYLDVLADRDLDNLPAVNDIVARVAVELRRGLVGGGAPTVKIVAQALGVSSRTLQRRIAEAGSTFERVIDDVRKARAKELIMEGGRAMSEIAYMLGYSEQAAFSRAAQRWFAAAPSRMVRMSKAGDDKRA